jgi:hypothetical protein
LYIPLNFCEPETSQNYPIEERRKKRKKGKEKNRYREYYGPKNK